MRTDDWCRLPKRKQRHCGLSRTSIVELGEAGLVKIAAIHKPGAIHAMRLLYLPSLLEYLERATENKAGRRNKKVAPTN